MPDAVSRRRRAEQVAETVLYEGHVLYPHRASSAKNRSRWTFHCLFPHDHGAGPSLLQLQCLLLASGEFADRAPEVEVRVRFLHLVQRGDWQEASEREVGLGPFRFDSGEQAGDDGMRRWERIEGRVDSECVPVAPGAWRLEVTVHNLTPIGRVGARADALPHALASTHVLLEARGGAQFVSMIDPPPDLRRSAEACRNDGAWPVLIGSETASDTMLASPIILYDDPQLAPESPGLLYDAGEIDEILNLRVLTLADDEEHEAAALDPGSRASMSAPRR